MSDTNTKNASDPKPHRNRRQDDDNSVDITEACNAYDGVFTSNMCGIIATYSVETDIFAAILGNFNLNSGGRLVHSFDSDCNHLSSAEVEPNGGFNGFSGSVKTLDDEAEVEVTIPCYDTACSNGVYIGEPELSGPNVPKNADGDSVYSCGDQEEWSEGIGAYSYRMCTWFCEN